ncbi:hypothetical protein AB6G29_22085 [Providencia hangzhouensis]|uniref:hypothetical protein n=1 Tax=Providencia hangzhouensis TaxID=3031799 RepID=UPI0034DD964B
MSNSNDTIDYTIRGIPIALDLVISELAAVERLPKSTYIRNKLSEIFLNRYDQYAATSSLVAAYDEKLARDSVLLLSMFQLITLWQPLIK